MKKWFKRMLLILFSIALIWAGLTVWAELSGKQQIKNINVANTQKNALILYNPDPIYNLDEQICNALANKLKAEGFSSVVLTNKKVENIKDQTFDLYFFCTNTYNFAPDIGIRKAIKKLDLAPQTPVVAITLGSGTTARAKRLFDKFLQKSQFHIVDSKTLWLMRPNDESRMQEPNNEVAVDIAQKMVPAAASFIEKK